jgi:hypothetical protein
MSDTVHCGRQDATGKCKWTLQLAPKENEMKVSEEFPSKYISAADLKGNTVFVTISSVDKEKIGDDDKLIVYFQGKQKGLALNKTNAFTIAQAYGDETNDWRGGELELFPIMTDYKGKTVEAVRLRIPARRPAQGQKPSAAAQVGFDEENPAPPPARSSTKDAMPDDEIPF